MTMTLDEAIQHCEEVAETNERICDTEPSIGLPDIYKHKDEAKKCASEHRQLAEWLKELKAYRNKSEIPTSCGDAISRQAVLNAMYELCDTGETLKENPWRDNPHIDGVVEAIEELPSVTPQQMTGRWIPVGYDGYADGNPVYDWWECSECGWEHTGDEESLTAFCPNCGCAMKGELE